jgi:branched-chain amino acid transport system permease protein
MMRMSKTIGPAALTLTLAIALAVLGLPFAIRQPAYQNYAILVLMAAQMGVAWNILGGYAGQVSLGHAAFFGIGAYTSSMLATHAGLSPWLAMPAGGCLAALFAVVVGWPCFRLKGHYFAMATIAVAEITQVVVTNWDYLEGAIGLYLPMSPSGLAAFVFVTKIPYYYIALGLLVLTLAVNWAIEHSYVGYYLRAIKDEPDAARSLGVSLTRYKLIAMAASSFLTAMGGTFYAQKELFIDPPSVIGTQLSIKIALVAILGGVGTLFGPVVGAIVLISIEESSRILFGSSGQGTDMIIYGALIVGVAVYSPSGVTGLFRDLGRFLRPKTERPVEARRRS